MELRDQMQKVALEWPCYGYRKSLWNCRSEGLRSITNVCCG